MKDFAIAVIYASFFGAIAFGMYITQSATPLWAILLTPSVKWKSNKCKQCKAPLEDEE